MSNTAFNNNLFSALTISFMHEQMTRLYLAAKELLEVKGQSNVARLLNESAQTVKNWETRGISQPGAIKAQAAIGCNANWLMDGTGPMVSAAIWPFPTVGPAQYAKIDEAIRRRIESELLGEVVRLQGAAPKPFVHNKNNPVPTVRVKTAAEKRAVKK